METDSDVGGVSERYRATERHLWDELGVTPFDRRVTLSSGGEVACRRWAPPTASWGEIVSQGREFVGEGLYHLVLAPGVAIFLTVTAFNLMGQALRDAMDPRLRH